MRGLTDRLTAFNVRFGRPVREYPSSSLPTDEIAQALQKLDEELQELLEAIDAADLVGIADGLGDVIYVVAGISVQFGIDIDHVLDLIHRSNMTKDVHDEGPMKGDSYSRPQIEAAIANMTIRLPPSVRNLSLG